MNDITWEVSSGDPGNSVVKYFDTVDEVLEFCGKLLYGNAEFLFDIVRIDIRKFGSGEFQDFNAAGFAAQEDFQPHWTLRSKASDGTISCRLIATKHELFGMLIADLKRGSVEVQVYDLTYT